MTSRPMTIARWVGILPLALLGAAVAQFLVYRAGIELAALVYWDGWITWAIKTYTSVFMGAAFVSVAWVVAPDHKRTAAAGALLLTLAWAGTLMAGAFDDRGFFPWLLAIGAAGALGGATAFWAGRYLFPDGRRA